MAGTKRFQHFCTRYNIDTPFPVTEHLLCCFAAYLADDGLAPQSIKSYLSAVRNLQLSLGLPDPREQSTLPLLRRVQAGIARCRVRKGTPRQVRLPITSHILARISERLRATSHPEQVVVRAVAFSAFFGFFRLGELLPVTQAAYNPATSLSWGDVTVDSHMSPRMIQFHLRHAIRLGLGQTLWSESLAATCAQSRQSLNSSGRGAATPGNSSWTRLGDL